MSANVAYVWTNISWIYLLYSCIPVNRIWTKVSSVFIKEHTLAVFSPPVWWLCRLVGSLCYLVRSYCQNYDSIQNIFMSLWFSPTVNNQIRLFFFSIFTLFTCKNNQLFKDSLSKFKNTFYDCIVDRKNIPIHCQCLRNSSMFSLCFTILWPLLIIYKLCVIITIQVLLCIFIKRTPFMSHYLISVSWYYIIKCRHFKNIEETMN